MSDETVTTLQYRKEQLIEELEHAQLRLQELEEAQADLQAREEDLKRQKAALNIGDGQQGRKINVWKTVFVVWLLLERQKGLTACYLHIQLDPFASKMILDLFTWTALIFLKISY